MKTDTTKWIQVSLGELSVSFEFWPLYLYFSLGLKLNGNLCNKKNDFCLYAFIYINDVFICHYIYIKSYLVSLILPHRRCVFPFPLQTAFGHNPYLSSLVVSGYVFIPSAKMTFWPQSEYYSAGAYCVRRNGRMAFSLVLWFIHPILNGSWPPGSLCCFLETLHRLTFHWCAIHISCRLNIYNKQ